MTPPSASSSDNTMAPVVSLTPSTSDVAEQLRQAVGRLNRRLRSENPGGVTPAQLTALLILDREGQHTLGTLAERVMVSPPSMNRTVTQLVELGFAEREQSPDDRRVTRLRITDSGRVEAERTRLHRNAWLGRRLAELTDEQRAEVQRVAEFLSEAACR